MFDEKTEERDDLIQKLPPVMTSIAGKKFFSLTQRMRSLSVEKSGRSRKTGEERFFKNKFIETTRTTRCEN